MELAATIIGGVIGALIFGLVIWVIAKLGLGIEVDSYGWAVAAGVIISAFSNFFATIIPDISGILGAIISLVVAAIVILLSDKILRGMRTKGFTGAIVAAISIGVVQFIFLVLLGVLAEGA